MGFLRLLVLTLLAAAIAAGPARAHYAVEEAPLKDWAVGILAADWRDSEGTPIDAFENARRALAEAFAQAGFNPDNITHLSLRPRDLGGFSLSSREVFAAFEAQARSAQAGCLYYFTSHGMPEGMVIGREGFLSPEQLNELINQWCGERPTVVIVSACYSGVFAPALQAANRLVITAARPDRSSFGCSTSAQYPYFDGCILESLGFADDFVHLANLARRCVAGRELRERLWPPSEPQAVIGADVERFFIFLDFERPPLIEE